jgi:hypothetical protein
VAHLELAMQIPPNRVNGRRAQFHPGGRILVITPVAEDRQHELLGDGEGFLQ